MHLVIVFFSLYIFFKPLLAISCYLVVKERVKKKNLGSRTIIDYLYLHGNSLLATDAVDESVLVSQRGERDVDRLLMMQHLHPPRPLLRVTAFLHRHCRQRIPLLWRSQQNKIQFFVQVLLILFSIIFELCEIAIHLQFISTEAHPNGQNDKVVGKHQQKSLVHILWGAGRKTDRWGRQISE